MNLTQNKLKLFASPWTAPLWLKTSPSYAGSGTIKEEFYYVWAKYFEKFFDQYQKHGVEFWGVTTGNEPSLTIWPGQTTPTVGWTPAQMVSLYLTARHKYVYHSMYVCMYRVFTYILANSYLR